jgi:hypothetical protein
MATPKGKAKSKAKAKKAKSASPSRSPSPRNEKKVKDKDVEQERQIRYAILKLPKDEKKELLKLARAAVEACQSLNGAWNALASGDSGAKIQGLTITQFSVGLSNSGVHKANAKMGGDTIDAVACYNHLRMDPDTVTLSYKEFLALGMLFQDAEVRLQLKDVEQIGDKQNINPIDRCLIELWLHILPYRSSSLKRKMPTEAQGRVCQQYLRAMQCASTAIALVKFEVQRLASAGVLVLRELLMTYSRSMPVVQEVIRLASCWAGIPTFAALSIRLCREH